MGTHVCSIEVLPADVREDLRRQASFVRAVMVPTLTAIAAYSGLALLLSLLMAGVDYYRHDHLQLIRCACCYPFKLSDALRLLGAGAALGCLIGLAGGLAQWGASRRGALRDLAANTCERHVVNFAHEVLYVPDEDGVDLLVFADGSEASCMLFLDVDEDPRWHALDFDHGQIDSRWSWLTTRHSKLSFSFEATGTPLPLRTSGLVDQTALFAVLQDYVARRCDGLDGGGLIRLDMPYAEVVRLAERPPGDAQGVPGPSTTPAKADPVPLGA